MLLNFLPVGDRDLKETGLDLVIGMATVLDLVVKVIPVTRAVLLLITDHHLG